MGATSPIVLRKSRIAKDSDRSGWAAVDATADVYATQFILGTQIAATAGKTPVAAAYKLRWRVDGGTFADVASTGKVKWATSSDELVDDATLIESDKVCGGLTSFTWADGVESVGDNRAPDSGTISLSQDYYTEIQWALDISDADLGDTYELELWNVSTNVSAGICSAKVIPRNAPPEVQLHTADESEFSTGRPELEFTGTDLEGDNITYEVNIFEDAVTDVYIGGATTHEVWKIDKSTMNEPASADKLAYGGAIYGIAIDDTHVYIGGGTTVNEVWKIDKSTMSEPASADKLNYGGTIWGIVVDDTHIYIVGAVNNEVWKIDKETMSEPASADKLSYGTTIYGIAIDDTHIYIGGLTTNELWKIDKSTMNEPAAADKLSYGGTIRDIAIDDTHVYIGGATTNELWKVNKSTMAAPASANKLAYGGTIYGIAVDDTHVYIGGLTTNEVWKIDKETMSEPASADKLNYGGSIRGIAEDDTHVYIGGAVNDEVWKIDKSTMAEPSSGDKLAYGGAIYGIAVETLPPIILKALSSEDAGFENIDTPADTDPFNSGDRIKYTVPEEDALADGDYMWRVRGKDPDA